MYELRVKRHSLPSNLATGEFAGKSEVLERAFTGCALITLDFDLLAFNRTTHAAFLFKRFEMAFNSAGGTGRPLITVTAFPPRPLVSREILTIPSPTWLGRLLPHTQLATAR